MTAIYARQSIDKGEQSLSIESQFAECGKRAAPGEVIEFYKDRGYSGSNTDRPDFLRMMGDIKSGRVHRLIVWKLDRVSRSLMDFANIISVFDGHRVAFDSVTEQLDTSTPMGRAMINIIMVFAQLERETIQMRIAANYRQRAEHGFFLGGPSAFGLVKKKVSVNGYRTSTFELCPEYGQTLLMIFDRYANTDMSLGSLARSLNKSGLTAQNGTPWESQKLSRILHNPAYVMSDADVYQFYKSKGANVISPVDNFMGNGLYLFGRRKSHERKYTSVKGHTLAVALHRGFIDSGTWLKAQYKLEGNVQIKNSGKGRHTWLSGIAKCGLCGYAMTGQKSGAHVILRCSRRINFKDCGAKNTGAGKFEALVWNALLSKLEELRGVAFTERKQFDAAENRTKAELIKIEEQIGRLVTALEDGDAPKSVTKRIADLETRQDGLRAQLQKEKAKSPAVDTDMILSLVKGELTAEEKKGVARAMIEKVCITDGAEPVIEWKF